jgi:hypothetical protein
MFQARDKEKKFCSMACYTSHPDTRERLQAMNEAKKTPPHACPNCKKTFQHKSKKYCSSHCRREYFSSRFDRWIANPEQIALPQNYDEFMTKDILPCLVDGCDWEGTHLGAHVNFKHGITADKFRELVGFCRSTGLVGAALSKTMSDRMKKLIADGIIDTGHNLSRHNLSSEGLKGPRGPHRLESKEHHRKARALLAATAPPKPPRQCLQCGEDAPQPIMGRRLYCSNTCRRKYYERKGAGELLCSFCGTAFMAKPFQLSRAREDKKVCCSVQCRNRMNVVACLAARGIDYDYNR